MVPQEVEVRRVIGAALVWVVGCQEFGLDPIEQQETVRRVTVTESFVQEALPQVDLLFVVDRTASMGQEHAALVSAASLLAERLAEAGVNWQLGIVDMDMGLAEAGWLLGDPWVFTPSSGSLSAHLETVLQTQAGSSLSEAGIAAAISALDQSGSGGVNEGFRRSSAALHVVFLSDGDDQSDGLVDNPSTALQQRLLDEGVAETTARVSAVVGDTPDGCVSVFGSAQAGTRYVLAAESTGGAVVSICTTDFLPVVTSLGKTSVVLADRFALREQPAVDTATVLIDGAPSLDWQIDLETASLVFESPPAAGAQISVQYLVDVVGP